MRARVRYASMLCKKSCTALASLLNPLNLDGLASNLVSSLVVDSFTFKECGACLALHQTLVLRQLYCNHCTWHIASWTHTCGRSRVSMLVMSTRS